MVVCRGCGAVSIDTETVRLEERAIPYESEVEKIHWATPKLGYRVIDGMAPVELNSDYVLCASCTKKLKGSE